MRVEGFEYRTTFGSVPIGTCFAVEVRDRDPADRRRKITIVRHYVKATHGSGAGFAQVTSSQVASSRDTVRFEHYTPVYVRADLRLIVACMRNKPCE